MNNVTLIGRLTKDVELKETQNGNKYVNFCLAVKRRKEDTDFINIVAWNKTAEFVAAYFEKGRQMGIMGRLQSRSWESEGKKHFAMEVVADEVYFADSKKAETQEQSKSQEPSQDQFYDYSQLGDQEIPF